MLRTGEDCGYSWISDVGSRYHHSHRPHSSVIRGTHLFCVRVSDSLMETSLVCVEYYSDRPAVCLMNSNVPPLFPASHCTHGDAATRIHGTDRRWTRVFCIATGTVDVVECAVARVDVTRSRGVYLQPLCSFDG